MDEVIRNIGPKDPRAEQAARAHWNNMAKPLGSLGVLEEDVIRIAALTGREQVRLDRRLLFVICADNGVVARGVSQSDASVTAAVAAALGRGESTVNAMAEQARCRVIPVDAGMAYPTPPGVLPEKILPGTGDITLGPAMTRAECRRAIDLGIRLAEEPADILLLGEMGIGNTTTSAAVASVLLGRSPAEMAGRGAGLSRAGLGRKIAAIHRAMEVNRPDPADPVDVLAKVGGLDLAVLCGICLGAAMRRVPVLLDGLITGAAALCAVGLCPEVRNALIASHVSAEPAARLLLEALELEPCISAGLRLGEGTGAVMALSLLDQALAVYHSGHTFGHLGIDAYMPQEDCLEKEG